MEATATLETRSTRSGLRSVWTHITFHRLLAVVLGIAAVLKLYSQQLVHLQDAYRNVEPILEVALAGWLWSNVAIRWASRVALIVFVGFAIITLVKVHHAATSCGCFGSIKVPPTRMLVFDFVVVFVLITQRGVIPRAPLVVRITIGLTITVGACGAYAYLSPRQQAAIMTAQTTAQNTTDSFVTGKSISATRWLADLNAVHAGESASVLFELTSPNNQELKVRGVDISCGCTSLPSPPAIIHAKGITPAKVVVRFPQRPGSFDSQVNLTTNAIHLPPITLEVRAKIQ